MRSEKGLFSNDSTPVFSGWSVQGRIQQIQGVTKHAREAQRVGNKVQVLGSRDDQVKV